MMRRGIVTMLTAILLSVGCSRDPSYDGRSADDWATMLRSANTRDRFRAATAFANARPQRLEHVRPLLVAMSDPDSAVRRAARNAVRVLPNEASKALVAALHDTSIAVRRGAAFGLGHLRDDGDAAIRELAAATSDSDDSVRTLSVMSLGQRSIGARDALDLIRHLAITPGPQRAAALMVLPNIDTESRSLLGTYLPALNDTSARVRAAAAWMVVAAASSEYTIPLLVKALGDPDGGVRLTALRSLAVVAHHDSTAYAAILSMHTSRDTMERRVADSVANVVRPP